MYTQYVYAHWLPDGARTDSCFTEGPQIPVLPYVASTRAVCRMFAACAPHAATKVDYGESRHFRDDPACPDRVWKLSMRSFMGLLLRPTRNLSWPIAVFTPKLKVCGLHT